MNLSQWAFNLAMLFVSGILAVMAIAATSSLLAGLGIFAIGMGINTMGILMLSDLPAVSHNQHIQSVKRG